MTDDQLLRLVDELRDCPRQVFGNVKVFLTATQVVTMHRVGHGQRWALSGRDVVSTVRWVGELSGWQPMEIRTWVWRGLRLNIAQHARAMGARTI